MTIPKAVREQVWIDKNKEKFRSKCYVSWCKNEITVFNFHCGHNIPDSKGGSIQLENLYPICSNCNLGMCDRMTITEWNNKYKRTFWFLCCIPCTTRDMPNQTF